MNGFDDQLIDAEDRFNEAHRLATDRAVIGRCKTCGDEFRTQNDAEEVVVAAWLTHGPGPGTMFTNEAELRKTLERVIGDLPDECPHDESM